MKILDATVRPITPEAGIRSLVWAIIPVAAFWALGLLGVASAAFVFGLAFGGQLMVSAGIAPTRSPIAFTLIFATLTLVLAGPLWQWISR